MSTSPIIETPSNQTILVTGCAGFIGWKVCEQLLASGCTVVGVDNLNDAYDARLKEWRLAQLQPAPGFHFHRADITDRAALKRLSDGFAIQKIDAVINLAAMAGVRYSVVNPWVYVDTNITGTLNLLEMCREIHRSAAKMLLAYNHVPQHLSDTDDPHIRLQASPV